MLVLAVGAAAPAASSDVPPALEIRSFATFDYGISRPAGLAYVPADRSLLLVEREASRTNAARVTEYEDFEGTLKLPAISNPASLAFNPKSSSVAAVDGSDLVEVDTGELRSSGSRSHRSDIGSLGLADPQGATYDPGSGTWFVLEGDRRVIARVEPGTRAKAERISLEQLGTGRLQGLALNPADGLLYVAKPGDGLLFGVDETGRVEKTYDLGELGIEDLQAFVFAPSADPTDSASRHTLYIADAGGPRSLGQVVEAALEEEVMSQATTVTGSEVQRIQTSQYSPPSPDPAGIAYDPASDRLLIGDSEVDEMNLYQGKNLFAAQRMGGGTGTGTTLPWSREPAGIGFDPGTRTLYVSDDDSDRVYVVLPGADTIHGTPDDVVSSISTPAFGSGDPEDVEYDSATGHLFVADGIGAEVYRIDPVDGVFGNGNDTVTNFDVYQHGARDAEGIGIDSSRGLLLVMDPSTKSIYEFTREGALVRVIDCRGVGLMGNRMFADATVAPTSDPNDSPSRLNYWIVDRQVDNGADPNENDGLLYEVSAPTADAPPSVTLTSPSEGAVVSGSVVVQASASDDVGVTQVAFAVDGTSIGVDTDGSNGWSVSWNTTTSSDGPRTVSATATDTLGQTASDSNGVIVDNVDLPPTISVSSPSEGAVVSGSVVVQASASDDVGVTQVAFAVDGTSIGVDTDGSNGWSVSWNTTTSSDGPRTVSATATDTLGQTASDSNGVIVDNTPPTVTVTAPSAGSTVSGTATVQADATDTVGVSSVQFYANGTSIGTDTSSAGGWSVPWNTTSSADGAYQLTAMATDAGGHSTTSASVSVTVDNPNVLTLVIPVASGTDDAVEYPSGGQGFAAGAVSLTQGDLELGTDKGSPTVVGVRFTGVSVPRGATITRAFIQFQVDENGKTATTLAFRGQNSDSAATFTNAAFGISSRPLTSSSVSWSVPRWIGTGTAGPDQRTPDLKAVIQEIVNRTGWSSGNALAIIVTGSGRRTAESFNGGATPPILHIEYTLPSP